MHKLRKAAVLVAALSTAGALSVGTAQAAGLDGGGNSYNVQQGTECKSHDLNLDILGVVGILNGVLGSGVNGEGNSGAQSNHLGSTMGCSNTAF